MCRKILIRSWRAGKTVTLSAMLIVLRPAWLSPLNAPIILSSNQLFDRHKTKADKRHKRLVVWLSSTSEIYQYVIHEVLWGTWSRCTQYGLYFRSHGKAQEIHDQQLKLTISCLAEGCLTLNCQVSQNFFGAQSQQLAFFRVKKHARKQLRFLVFAYKSWSSGAGQLFIRRHLKSMLTSECVMPHFDLSFKIQLSAHC